MRTSQKALLAPIALVLAGLLLLAGCGDDSEPEGGTETTPSETVSDTPAPSDSPSKSPKPSKEATSEGQSIDITITHDSVSPNGDRVEVELGEPITLNIDAAEAGELHVHSTPEQVLSFKKGESMVEVTIDTPGVVDVEEHEAHKVLLQLEVR